MTLKDELIFGRYSFFILIKMNRMIKIQVSISLVSNFAKAIKQKLTSFECVLFWCLALSEALLKAFVHPGNSQV